MKKTTSAIWCAQSYDARVVARDLLTLTAVFVAVTALAAALGAANLGTAATFGQVAFVLALTATLVRR
jgi:hypothetical protein